MPADGYASPDQLAPDAWLLCFARHHADAAVWSGLFSSCRSGRDFVLTRARQAALTLTCDDQPPDAGWRQLLLAVRHALAVRGARPTSISAQHDRDDRSHKERHWLTRLLLLPGVLAGVGEGVTELDLDLRGNCDIGPVLALMACACPHTTGLSIEYNSNQQAMILPHPSQWPRLRSLRYPKQSESINAGRLWPHIVPYTTQLTTLQLPRCYQQVPWSLLFPPHLPATLPLTHLETEEGLDDMLVNKLLTHAPHLTYLVVHDIGEGLQGDRLEVGAYRDRVWGVSELKLIWWRSEPDVLSRLVLLPKPPLAAWL